MKTRLHVFGMVIAAAGLMFLSACGGDNNNSSVTPAPAATNTPVPTAKATNTTAPTNTAVPPTSTAVPPTNTQPSGPTNTPTNTVVVNTPTPTNTQGGAAVCGNGTVEGDEQCDDGNTFGGDGCAANCTTETRQDCVFGEGTGANVQTAIFAIPLALTGKQVLTTGTPRTSDPNMIAPIVIKAADVAFDPVQVPGLVCACVRAGAKDEYGPGNSGLGQTSCSDAGLQDINYVTTVDHNTNDQPGACAGCTAGDSSCTSGFLEDGSAAHPHAGVCNGLPQTVHSGGNGGVGATIIDSNTGITLISDSGTCSTDTTDPNKGPDGIPCDDDDPNQVAPSVTNTTSGTAGAQVIDANNAAGKKIAAGQACGATSCATQVTGIPANCATGSVSGSATASAFVGLDAAQIGDEVVTSTFVCQ